MSQISSALFSTSPAAPMKRTVALVLASWGAVSLLAAAAGIVPHLPRLLVPVLIWLPVAIVAAVYRRSAAFRAHVGTVPPWLVILLHTVRVPFGVAFVVLAARGVLPHGFADVAGPGDILVGALALPAAALARSSHPAARRAVLAWNAIALLDILLAVVAAQRQIFLVADPRMLAGFALFPFGTLPLFVVPLILITHLGLFVRLGRAPSKSAAS